MKKKYLRGSRIHLNKYFVSYIIIIIITITTTTAENSMILLEILKH